MSNPYLKFVGKIMGKYVGALDSYSEEHRKFLTSGFICANCNETLMHWWGVANVTCLSSEGEKVSLLMARTEGHSFECPKCKFQWPARSPKK